MRSVGLAVVALVALCAGGVIAAGCGGASGLADAGAGPVDGAVGDAAPADAAPEVPPDPGACLCQVDSAGTLTLSWACYCTQSFVSCGVPLGVPASCATFTRTDYPDCGLTVLVDDVGPSAGLPSVYDATGKLVGRSAASDLSLFLCPSDPATAGFAETAGQFPDASCRAVICGGCYAGPFPCPAPDGGADASPDGQTDAADAS